MARMKIFLLFMASLSLGSGCITTTNTTVSLQDLNCQSCGAAVVHKLSKEDGVKEAVFDRKVAEVRVQHDATVWNGERLASAIQGYGYGARSGAGQGNYIPFPDYPETADVVWLSKSGETFDEKTAAVPGKMTVVDFYAPWCGPCREVDRFLIYQLSIGNDFAVRKVNVQDWDSEVAAQLGERLTGLPYVQVYDANGELMTSIGGLNLEALKKVMVPEEGTP